MAAGTAEELRSTGKLGIVNPSIRSEPDKAIEQSREFDRIWPQAAERATPHVSYVDSQIAVRMDREMRGNNEIVWDQLQIELGTVCEDQRSYNAIAAVRNHTFDVAAWLKVTREGFEQLRVALKLEMRSQGLVLAE